MPRSESLEDEFVKRIFLKKLLLERSRRSGQSSSEQAFLGLVVGRPGTSGRTESKMQISDVTCSECNAGYRRLQLSYQPGTTGEYRCRWCDHVLEVFDGSACVAFRLTVQPERASHAASTPVAGFALPRRQRALP